MPESRKLIRMAFLAILGLGLIFVLTTSNAFYSYHQPSEISQLPPSTTDIRISISQEGIYRIGLQEIGWEQVPPDRLQLTQRAQPQPIWVEGQGSEAEIFFYGQPSESLYSPENFYLLSQSDTPGPRMAAGGAMRLENTSGSNPVTVTLKIEENQLYAPQAEQGDNWFWRRLAAPQTEVFEVELSQVATGGGRLQAELWGYTQAPADPDHRVRLWVNGILVADQTWDGQHRATIAAAIPGGTLQEGSNRIEVEIPGFAGESGDGNPAVEIVYLDWLEIDYARDALSIDDSLIFTTGTEPLKLAGFSGAPVIFDITDPQEITRTALAGESGWFLGEPGHRYLALGPQGARHPDGLYPAQTEPDLRQPEIQADYLVIGPSDLLTPLQPLLDWRESQGLSPLSIPVQAVYDQFNGGMPEPEAIQQFLAYAARHWKLPPRYVLLVGDSSYDFRGYTSPAENNRLPTMMIPTEFGGKTGSDIAIAQINQDPWPDLAIGRLPAASAGQVAGWVEKTLAYEKQPFDPAWQRHILAIADGQEPRFQWDAQNFLEIFPPDYSTELISPPAGTTENTGILQAIENGSLITAYFGHGSLKMWGKDRLFTSEDSLGLSNAGRLPVMLHITCLTGFFIHPSQTSLAEELLWQPKGGAVAVLAPTSLTLPDAQDVLTSAFARALLQSSDQRLGDIVLAAWRQVPVDDANAEDVMLTFLLFGDPALVLPGLR